MRRVLLALVLALPLAAVSGAALADESDWWAEPEGGNDWWAPTDPDADWWSDPGAEAAPAPAAPTQIAVTQTSGEPAPVGRADDEFTALLPDAPGAPESDPEAVPEDGVEVAAAAPAERRDRGGNDCRRLPLQIAKFEKDLELAEARGDDGWKQSTEAHIERLEARYEKRCPEPQGPGWVEALTVFAAGVAKVAAKAYTWGLY